MADTPFTGFTPVTSLLGTDNFLAQRGAGGINFPAAVLAKSLLALGSDGSGNIGIGAAASGPSSTLHVGGSTLLDNGASAHSTPLVLNNDLGAPAQTWIAWRNLGATKASIRASVFGSDFMIFATGTNVDRLQLDGMRLTAVQDNTLTLGTGSLRWAGGYIATAWVVTSDEREKLWVTITEDRRAKDRRIAYAILEELGWYQRLDSIEEKGEDGARWHFGARAQAAWAIVAAEGLCAPLVGTGAEQQPDPAWTGPPPPAWLCYDVWEEERTEEPVYSETLIGEDGKPLQTGTREVVTREAGNRFGLRTDQLDMLLSWALYERDKEKDALIADLTARLEALEEPEWQGGLMDGEL